MALLDKLKEKNKSEDIIKKAIKGMLPNSPLFRDLMKNNLKLKNLIKKIK